MAPYEDEPEDRVNAVGGLVVKNGMGGGYDVNWPNWYAAYMLAEQARTDLPT